MNALELLRELSQAHGVSGYETALVDIAKRAMAPYATDIRVDAMQNMIALRRGAQSCKARRSIMLAAHSDEIGLIVTALDKGFIRFGRVGGVDIRTIVGQEVLVHSQRDLPGIIASLPPHVVSVAERAKPIPLDKLFIDVGMDADKLASVVHVGDTITMRRDVLELANGYASGQAFDDRAGIVAVALCMEQLSRLTHAWDVYAVATSQEEVGLRGAMTSVYGVAPDVAIAIDVGFGSQQGVAPEESIKMDGGPALAMGPNIHPLMFKRLKATATENEIPHQVEIAPGRTGTDAWALQVSREGVPSALLSVPLRYMHTSVETICVRDMNRTARLMALFIASLDDSFADELGL